MRKRSAPSCSIEPGDLVLALRDGQRSPNGFPVRVPKKGQLFRCKLVYPMWYGLGIQLHELNAKPYKGFFLFAHNRWYFKKVVQEETECDLSFHELLKTGIGIGTPIKERELEDA
jgi:hypothetical protein